MAALALRDSSAPSSSERFRGSTPTARVVAPDFSLPDQAGRIVSMRELRGKVVLVTFLDSQCSESCPIIANQISRGLDSLEPEERRQVVALAVSTDPEEDTRASVRAFLARNRALGKLTYLVAPEAEMRPVWDAFHILPSAKTGVDELHSAPVRIFDRRGVWVATLHSGADLTPANLAHDVRVALAS
jgi:protein SCO1